MRKILSVLLALVMVLGCAVSALAETAEDVTEKKELEEAAVIEWLLSQLSEEEAEKLFITGDEEALMEKLDEYDQPLEYTTKEEIAGGLEKVVGIVGLFAGLMENAGANGENTEEGGDLSALFGGLLGGSENGEEGGDLSALFGGLLGGSENGEEGGDLSALFGGLLGGSENGEESGDLSALFGALLGGEISMEGAYDDGVEEFSYQIVDLFDGTIWESGKLKLEAVFQDGYYKVAVTEGEKELSYLCEYSEYEEGGNSYPRLTGIGTGVEEFDAEQEDHGIATFTLNDEGNLVWKKADGTEVIFTEVVDPLTTKEWYADGKMLRISWLGDLDYTVTIEDWNEGNVWTYQCTLDEATDTLTGTGTKEQYGEEVYTDADATFTFSDARILLTWKDDKAEEAAEGITFEMVETAFTMVYWQADGVEDYAGYFADGKYHIELTLEGTRYAYVCTYDRESSTLTAVDPATLNPEEYSEPENYRSTGTFEMLDDDDMRWMDDSGATGADGITLHPAV